MTTAKPPARYSAPYGARAGGFALTQLHHSQGRDQITRQAATIQQTADRFQRHFVSIREQGLVYTSDDHSHVADWDVAWRQPWTSGHATGSMPQNDTRTQGARAFETLPHEIGHTLFIVYVWPSSSSVPHYGGDAPDWLDEAAAMLTEDPEATERQRVMFGVYTMRDRMIAFDRYFHMTHPAMTTPDIRRMLDQARARAKMEGAPVTVRFTTETEIGTPDDPGLFYAQTRGFVDYLLARTGEDRVFLEIAEHLKAGGSMAGWLRDGSTARAAALPHTLEGLDADFRAWARG